MVGEEDHAPRPTLLLERAAATELLKKHIDAGGELGFRVNREPREFWLPDATRWIARAAELLRSIFSTDEYATAFRKAADQQRMNLWDNNTRGRAFSGLINELQAVLENLDLIPPAPGASDSLALTPERLRNVFLVHGHDHAARDAVAAFVRRIGLQVTVLEEKPGGGRTIIEQFEKHADVGFALVLLTGDDVGAAAGRSPELKPRPRQNVVLELGYFYGRLGRERVRALVKGDIEYPSDIGGVLYTKVDDAGAWQLSLAREMRDAKMAVDLNKL